jgi:murein DD-endopeptidase MepM/ murein hydrolase activator NlpD
MRWAAKRRTRTLFVSVAVFATLVALIVLIGALRKKREAARLMGQPPAVPAATPPLSQSQNNSPEGQPTALSSPSVSATPFVPVMPSSSPGKLIIPVLGVRPEQLRDTFSEARSEGRIHDAIDIAAPKGTLVIAAADGPIVKLFHSERGGTTVYQLSTDGKFVYYYAHLDRYAEGLTEGHFAKQGETIAFVGDSGNAGAGNYHLHFSVAEISNPKDFWHGVNINPYPLLRQ